MLYEPHHGAPKRWKQKEVIQRGKHAPKECELYANDAHYVSRLVAVIPKLNVHSFDENYSGDEFNQCHYQRHHEKHQDIIYDSVCTKAHNVGGIQETQSEKGDRSKSIDWQARPGQKSGIEPQSIGICFVEKSAEKQFNYPAQNSAKEKKKSHNNKSLECV